MKAPCLLLVSLSLLAGCQREDRSTGTYPASNEPNPVAVSTLVPGGQNPDLSDEKASTFEANAFHLSEGKRLFGWFNCSGCHANGGGGMGPALMDAKWIYGSSVESIHATIRDGRPNGMPTFRDRVPDDQIWEIAAYVRSLGGNVPSAASPGRDDSMMAHPAENRLPGAATLGKSP